MRLKQPDVACAMVNLTCAAAALIWAGATMLSPARAADTRAAEANTFPAVLDEVDATAALDGILLALTEVGDGGTYVWHRRDGKLSGMAQPSDSFKDQAGLPCRHLVVMLNTANRSSKVEGIACRLASGRWQLDG